MPRAAVMVVTPAATVVGLVLRALTLVAMLDIMEVILATCTLQDILGSPLRYLLGILELSTTGSEQDHTARLISLTTILAPELITVVILSVSTILVLVHLE